MDAGRAEVVHAPWEQGLRSPGPVLGRAWRGRKTTGQHCPIGPSAVTGAVLVITGQCSSH